MTVSILHRAAGEGLAFVGLPVLLWFLASLASGEGSIRPWPDPTARSKDAVITADCFEPAP